jgi:hypothetical protein
MDLIGTKFHKLIVIAKSTKDRKRWTCRCDCGSIKDIRYDHLLSGEISSCGCGLKNKDSFVGRKFTRLTVISFHESDKPITYYNCICDCGKEVVVDRCGLRTGNNKSCGCYKDEMSRNRTREKHPNWKSEISDEERLRRRQIDTPKYNLWRKSVFERDNFKCKICGSGGKINAHHIDGWNWAKDKRYDLNNGITMCEKHHDTFHDLYGRGDNTAEEFFEYYLVMKASVNVTS